MLKMFFVVPVMLVAILFIYAASRPDSFHVERSLTIKASPEKIFGLINDLHLWNEWTPYNKDPAMKKTYSGSSSGKGASYAWEGNKDVGKGEITITESTPSSRIVFDLHMIKPFEGHNVAAFTLDSAGDATRVTWSLDDKQKFIVRLIGIFMDMDKLIGGDFEKGLANLKAVAER
ncbi:MAG: SRPBCC family protein [Gammaproteobacteria bacterium]|nr:SRPBCC family protein [Gammaproteobacteria bacterium]